MRPFDAALVNARADAKSPVAEKWEGVAWSECDESLEESRNCLWEESIMARVPVRDLAKFGVVQDSDESLLPPNAWTKANNVRFRDGKIITSPGHIQAYEPPAMPPYWLMQVFSPVKDIAWLYGDLTRVYVYLGGLHTHLSRTTGGPDTTTMSDRWNGGVLAGIPVINNGQDLPQFWANVASATKLANLTNWPPTWRASVVRPFRNFLIAMNILEGPLRYIHRVRWSSPAQPD